MPLDREEPEQKKANSNIEGYSNRFFFIFKVFMFFFCFAGFIYQVDQFLQLYWKYPTVIDFAVEKPEYIIEPAVTFCSSATAVRKQYCDTYSLICKIRETVKKPICKGNPDYCSGKDKNDQLPNTSGIDSIILRTNDIKGQVKNISDMLIYPYSNLQGPFLLFKTALSPTLFCYTINSHVESGYEPPLIKLDQLYLPNYNFHLNSSEKDTFLEAGMYLHLHSPFMAVNPAMDGAFLKPGKRYILQVHLEEERLLPPPYPTNCKDYSAVWEQNNRTGARTQEMCMEKCKAAFDLICAGCVRHENLYPSSQRCDKYRYFWCNEEHSFWSATNDCLNNCRPDCVKLKYHYTVHEMNIEPLNNVTLDSIEVSVHLDQKEVPVRVYNPQYQDVELFSYLGGFLSCWLGISLYAFVDIIKSSYRSICRLYRKIGLKIYRLKHASSISAGETAPVSNMFTTIKS